MALVTTTSAGMSLSGSWRPGPRFASIATHVWSRTADSRPEGWPSPPPQGSRHPRHAAVARSVASSRGFRPDRTGEDASGAAVVPGVLDDGVALADAVTFGDGVRVLADPSSARVSGDSDVGLHPRRRARRIRDAARHISHLCLTRTRFGPLPWWHGASSALRGRRRDTVPRSRWDRTSRPVYHWPVVSASEGSKW